MDEMKTQSMTEGHQQEEILRGLQGGSSAADASSESLSNGSSLLVSPFPFSFSVGYVLFATLAIEVSIAFALLWSTWIRRNDLQYGGVRRTYYRSFSRQLCNILNILSLEACIALLTWSIIKRPLDQFMLFDGRTPSGSGSAVDSQFDDYYYSSSSSSSSWSVVVGQSWIGFLVASIVLSIPMTAVSSFLLSKHRIHGLVLLLSTLLLIVPGMVILSVYCKHMDILHGYNYYGSMRIIGVDTITEQANVVHRMMMGGNNNNHQQQVPQLYMGSVQVSWGRQWGCPSTPDVWCETMVYIDDCSYCPQADLNVFTADNVGDEQPVPEAPPDTLATVTSYPDIENSNANSSNILVKKDSRNVFTARHEYGNETTTTTSSSSRNQQDQYLPPSCHGDYPRGTQGDATQCVIDEFNLMDVMKAGIVLDAHNYDQMKPADQDFDWPTSKFYGDCNLCLAQSPSTYYAQLQYLSNLKPTGSLFTNLGGLIYVLLAITGGASHILKRTQSFRRSSNTTTLLGRDGAANNNDVNHHHRVGDSIQIRNNNAAMRVDDESGPLIRTESESNDSAICPHHTQNSHQHQQGWQEDGENEIGRSLMGNSYDQQHQTQQHYKDEESDSIEDDDDDSGDDREQGDIVVNVA